MQASSHHSLCASKRVVSALGSLTRPLFSPLSILYPFYTQHRCRCPSRAPSSFSGHAYAPMRAPSAHAGTSSALSAPACQQRLHAQPSQATVILSPSPPPSCPRSHAYRPPTHTPALPFVPVTPAAALAAVEQYALRAAKEALEGAVRADNANVLAALVRC